MIGQSIFFTLFTITLLVGGYVYFSPKHHASISMESGSENSPDEMTGQSSKKAMQQLNVTTTNGVVQIRSELEELNQEQKKFLDMINNDQQVLNDTNKRIDDILKEMSGGDNTDITRLKALSAELQDDQRLLVDHGRALVAFNDQLTQRRQRLAEQSDFLQYYSEASLQLLVKHNALLNDQSAALFEKVKQQNKKIIEHTKDLIDKEQLKIQDQQNR